MLRAANGFFVTGTDTGVGKSVASAALIRYLSANGKRVAGLKPIASGFDLVDGHYINEDVQLLTSASNVELPASMVNRYGFHPPIAPHIAADAAGATIDCAAIQSDVHQALTSADTVVVEGVGGWLVPLDAKKPEVNIQSLAQTLALPVIMVVGLRLGCLNHALLTADAIERSGLPLAGWVANHLDPHFLNEAENTATLEHLLGAPKLFDLEYASDQFKQLMPTNVHVRLSDLVA